MASRKRTLDEDEEDYQNELRQAELEDIQAGLIKRGKFVDDGQGGEESQEDEEGHIPEVVTKSGRVRKKSTKVIEMEEAEELERVTAKQPRATPKTPKRPKKAGEGAAQAASNIIRPVAGGAAAGISRQQPVASKCDAGLESLKMKLSAITADTVKKGKAKKAPAAPAPAASPPPAAVSSVVAPSSPVKSPVSIVTEMPSEAVVKQEVDVGSKLKMLLSPKKEKLPPAPSLTATMSALAAHLTTPTFIPTLTPQEQSTPVKATKKKIKKEPAVKKEVIVKEDPSESLSGPEMLSDGAMDASDSSPHPQMDSFDSASDLDVDSELIIADPPAVAEKKSPKKKSPKGKGKAITVAAALAAEAAAPKVLAERGVDEPAVVAHGDSAPVYANTQEMAMKLMTSAEKKANKGKKGKKPKKEEDPEKPKKKRAPTAYMLWCNGYRPRVVAENPGIDFAAISRRLGEIWQSLPDKEKMAWKRKAKKAANKGSTLISTGKTTAGKAASVPGATVTKPPAATKAEASGATKSAAGPSAATATSTAQAQFNADVSTIPAPGSPSYKVPGTAPVDAAAHLKLLGESLSIIGARLQEHRGQIAVQGSLSVLLDSLLCALGPLSCLTSVIPELNGCPSETHASTLDNIAYFMPGIG